MWGFCVYNYFPCRGTHAECGTKIKLSEFINIFFDYELNTSCNKIKCASFVLKAQSSLETLNLFTSTMFDIWNVACYTVYFQGESWILL
jgi:hypothetical protein